MLISSSPLFSKRNKFHELKSRFRFRCQLVYSKTNFPLDNYKKIAFYRFSSSNFRTCYIKHYQSNENWKISDGLGRHFVRLLTNIINFIAEKHVVIGRLKKGR